jgi:hypothetical protein
MFLKRYAKKNYVKKRKRSDIYRGQDDRTTYCYAILEFMMFGSMSEGGFVAK